MSVDDLLSNPWIWWGRDRGSSSAVTVATGFEDLDRYLPGGGWPLRAVTEIFVERYGVGELSLLMPALSRLSRRKMPPKRWIVWIAPPFVPYAPALQHYGIDLNRILLVHPTRSRRDALWAAEQVIRSRSSAVALAWVRDADATALRRMQLGAEEHECWTVLFRSQAALAQSSPAALRLKLSQASTPGTEAVGAAEAGYARLDVLKCRGRRPATIMIDNSVLRRPEPAAQPDPVDAGSGSGGEDGGSGWR